MRKGWKLYKPGIWVKRNMRVEREGRQWCALLAPNGNYAFLHTMGPYKTAAKAITEVEKENDRG